MRTSPRVAFAVARLVYAATIVLAWRRMITVPDGRGDVNGLLVATVVGFLGLALLNRPVAGAGERAPVVALRPR